MRTDPSVGSNSRGMSAANVDFPEPEGPTTAVMLPAVSFWLMPESTGVSLSLIHISEPTRPY